MIEKNPAPRRRAHSHMWVMGVLGLIAGAVLLIYVPSLTAISKSLLLFAGFHIVGGVVLLSSLYVSGLRGWLRKMHGAAAADTTGTTYNFGWGPGWMNGLAIAALACVAAAVAIQVTLPQAWPLSFLLVATAVVFVTGNLVMRGFRRLDQVVLPMVDLLSGDHDLVLDAGCGSGRTTIALSRILKAGRVIAFDRFDADYIDDGGRGLLARNLRIAGLTDRVAIETGDLTAMPFETGHFDAAVSTHVYDHLGSGKATALCETHRVLKPGGRFLMAVWVPSWTMFSIGNVFSLALARKSAWRRMAAAAGFELLDEGVFNGTWFVLLAKPAA
jgi:SAM-dependent methyltransferase